MKTKKMLVKLQKIFRMITNKFKVGLKKRKSILRINSRSKSKCCTKEKYPLMKKKLHEEFLELREKDTSVKRCWFAL